jgi:hypothetical protein
VSSLTRSDIDGLLNECGVSPLTDWQWRALVAIGLMNEEVIVPAAPAAPSYRYVLGPMDLWTVVHPDGRSDTYLLAIVKDGDRISAESVGDGFRWIDDDDQVWETLRLPEGGPMVWQRVG